MFKLLATYKRIIIKVFKKVNKISTIVKYLKNLKQKGSIKSYITSF